jgi:ketosteroid isomerase-like protein
MKTRLLLAVAGLAIGSALPTFAQQKETVDPQLREQIDAFAKKFDPPFINGDAAALAALYTEDAIEVTDQGPIHGREAIEKHYADLFQKVHFTNKVTTLDQDSPHVIGTTGNEVWETVAWSATIQGQKGEPIQIKGYASSIAVREGGVWRKRLLTWNVTPAPAAAPSPTTAPSNQ